MIEAADICRECIPTEKKHEEKRIDNLRRDISRISQMNNQNPSAKNLKRVTFDKFQAKKITLLGTAHIVQAANFLTSKIRTMEVAEEANKEYWKEIDNLTHLACENIFRCTEGFKIVFETDSKLEKCFQKLAVPGHSSLFALEENLLHLASGNELDGLFYCLVFDVKMNDKTLCLARYFEYGCFGGVFECSREMLAEQTERSEILSLKILNDYDVADDETRSNLLSQKKESKGGDKRSSFSRYMKTNKTSVVNSTTCLCSELEADGEFSCLGLVVFVERKNAKKSKQDDRETHCTSVCQKNGKRVLICQRKCHRSEEWEQYLLKYKISGQKPKCQELFETFPDNADIQQQLNFISEIPNAHKWLWNLGDPSKQQIKFCQRFSTSVSYPPSSPRKRIARAVVTNGDCRIVKKVIHTILKIYDDEKSEKQPQKKRRRVEKRCRPSINLKSICESFGIDQEEANLLSQNVSASFQNQPLYQYYVEKLLSNGCLNWRITKPSLEIVLMNDYDSENGEFKDMDFVHVTALTTTEDPIITCTCQLFGMLESSLEDPNDRDEGWQGITCCHSRLMKDICLLRKWDRDSDPPISIPKHFLNTELISKAETYASHPVVQLPSKRNVHKFSVSEDSDAEIVTIFWTQRLQKKIVTCHNSYCRSRSGRERTLENYLISENLCPHLAKLRDCFDVSELPFDTECQGQPEFDGFDENENDFEITDETEPTKEPWKKVFDEEKGMWTFHAMAKSKALVNSDPYNDDLKVNAKSRSIKILQNEEIDLIPLKDGPCDCNNVWYDENNENGDIFFDTKTVLYGVVGATEANVYKRRCLAGNCLRKYDGVEDSIFRLTDAVCCGYEVGWMFVDSVMTSKQTFSGFIKMMESQYFRLSPIEKYMSKATFIKWWFAWASAMEINFVSMCFGCGADPKIVAGDGTKIGITLKQANVEPIETKQDNIPVNTANKVYDRMLVNNRNSGKNRAKFNSSINSLALHMLGLSKVDEEKVFSWISSLEGLECTILLAVKNMVLGNQLEAITLAKLFQVLTEDKASLVNIIPEKHMPIMEQLITLLESTDIISSSTEIWNFKDEFFKLSRFFFPELGEWVSATISQSNGQEPKKYTKDFIRYIYTTRQNLSLENIPPEEPQKLKKYNPARDGRAYYFNEDGSQLRMPRKFTIDEQNEATPLCNKAFPTVTKKGTTYLFLWFCPCHGHCYGFHIIPKAEGRKDAANSLYCFLKNSPETVFYDFACGLEEYTRNRESGFFSITRIFHDIFHGYTHKCSRTFKSDRLLGFNGINTSICEQFNSFVQCIKSSARLMTQEHFSFYTQFFIHQWNLARKISYKKKASIALAGSK